MSPWKMLQKHAPVRMKKTWSTEENISDLKLKNYGDINKYNEIS